ncbi:MAG: glutamate 5-kinase [Myxococcota bacterium]
MTLQGVRAAGAVRRVVLKVGSSTVAEVGLDALSDTIHALRDAGFEVALVTSGAVACGMQCMRMSERPKELALVQALAAVGQADLMARYRTSFARHAVQCAQVLLTHEDLSTRKSFLNVRHAMFALLELGVVPIANENDTVATEELRFGDNDRLAAAFATVIDADLVILLSDIPCLYDRDPRTDPSAKPVPVVEKIDASVRAMAGAAGSRVGTGGMVSKIEAAAIAVEAGIPLVIASGSDPSIALRIAHGESEGTLFLPQKRFDRRRHWIGFLSRLDGAVLVDEGAVQALRSRGSSLLPIGVTGVEGWFERGDAVAVKGPDGAIVARGLVGYDARTLDQIRGLRSDAVAERLQRSAIDPVVHRNDLVLQ